ncbi:unnamed protein product [Amoebophrya sp. A120]|nr:unnamed protein product [Amoebophrya sp. A120]|eukprot:GSA120T00011041001.1
MLVSSPSVPVSFLFFLWFVSLQPALPVVGLLAKKAHATSNTSPELARRTRNSRPVAFISPAKKKIIPPRAAPVVNFPARPNFMDWGLRRWIGRGAEGDDETHNNSTSEAGEGGPRPRHCVVAEDPTTVESFGPAPGSWDWIIAQAERFVQDLKKPVREFEWLYVEEEDIVKSPPENDKNEERGEGHSSVLSTSSRKTTHSDSSAAPPVSRLLSAFQEYATLHPGRGQLRQAQPASEVDHMGVECKEQSTINHHNKNTLPPAAWKDDQTCTSSLSRSQLSLEMSDKQPHSTITPSSLDLHQGRASAPTARPDVYDGLIFDAPADHPEDASSTYHAPCGAAPAARSCVRCPQQGGTRSEKMPRGRATFGKAANVEYSGYEDLGRSATDNRHYLRFVRTKEQCNWPQAPLITHGGTWNHVECVKKPLYGPGFHSYELIGEVHHVVPEVCQSLLDREPSAARSRSSTCTTGTSRKNIDSAPGDRDTSREPIAASSGRISRRDESIASSSSSTRSEGRAITSSHDVDVEKTNKSCSSKRTMTANNTKDLQNDLHIGFIKPSLCPYFGPFSQSLRPVISCEDSDRGTTSRGMKIYLNLSHPDLLSRTTRPSRILEVWTNIGKAYVKQHQKWRHRVALDLVAGTRRVETRQHGVYSKMMPRKERRIVSGGLENQDYCFNENTVCKNANALLVGRCTSNGAAEGQLESCICTPQLPESLAAEIVKFA